MKQTLNHKAIMDLFYLRLLGYALFETLCIVTSVVRFKRNLIFYNILPAYFIYVFLTQFYSDIRCWSFVLLDSESLIHSVAAIYFYITDNFVPNSSLLYFYEFFHKASYI